MGEDLAAGEDLTEGEDLAEGDFFLPESPEGLATATVSLLPSLQKQEQEVMVKPCADTVRRGECTGGVKKFRDIQNWNLPKADCCPQGRK